MSSNMANMGLISAEYKVKNDKTFFEYVSENQDLFVSLVSKYSIEEAKMQIALVLKFMKYYMEANEEDGLLDHPSAQHEFFVNVNKSAFEILLDIHTAMRSTCVGFTLYFYGQNPYHDEFIAKILEFQNFEVTNDPSKKFTFDNMTVSYCTMIVFETSDLESAADILATAWTMESVPWAIRNVLVQESIQRRFVELVQTKLKPFKTQEVRFAEELRCSVNKAMKLGLKLIQNPTDNNDLKPTIVSGSSVDFLLEDGAQTANPVVVMNAFRTVKEAVSMVNKENGGSITLWTEELSLAFEVANMVQCLTVWVNGHGMFDPLFPFNFRKNEYCYGSEYAIYEKKVKKLFVKTTPTDTNSAEKNLIAIKKLGACPPKVANQRFSYLRNSNNIHFEVVSTAFQIEKYNANHKLAIVDDFWDKYATIDDADMNILFDSVYNQRKTIVIPYGVSITN